MKAFGIATSTNSGLDSEATGNYNYDYPLEKANTSFGQGVTVTPFQLVQAFTAIANDGKMMKLHYIDKVVGPKTGEETKTVPEEVSSPISAETAQSVLQYLTEVVYAEYGTASAYQIDNAEVGVKTGTAELVNPDSGRYYTGTYEYLYSTAGFAPIEDPEYILYVTLKLPKNNEQKLFVDYLSDVFNPLMTRAISYAELGEDSDTPITEVEIPSVINEEKAAAIDVLQMNGFSAIGIIGNGSRIVQQFPVEDTTTILNQKILLMTEGAMTMPDVRGWSRDDVLKVAEMTGVTFEFEGEGYVVHQELSEGSLLNPEDSVKIILE